MQTAEPSPHTPTGPPAAQAGFERPSSSGCGVAAATRPCGRTEALARPNLKQNPELSVHQQLEREPTLPRESHLDYRWSALSAPAADRAFTETIGEDA